MKVKTVAKQLAECERLERLIKDLDVVLKDFDRTEKPLADGSLINTSISLIGPYYTEGTKEERLITVNLNPNITELIRGEVKEILLQHRVDLRKQQDKLEVR